MTEAELNQLLILAQTGNYDAFEALHAYLQPILKRFVERILSAGQEAEDIVQDTLIALYTNLNRVQSGTHVRAYVLRVARNRCYDRLRHWQRFEQVTIDEQEGDFLPPMALADESNTPPDEMTHWLLLKAEVERAIENLPEAQREVLLLYCEDELSYAEIAEVMRISIGTVKSRLFHAKKNLRGMVRPEVLIAIQEEDYSFTTTTET
jgi:RNA polymerase sigma-70 factor, ECF subfamily